MDAYDIAPRLQAAVTRSGLRKAEIARRAGITWAQLHKALTGARPHISAETVRALALALDVSSDYLLGLAEFATPTSRCGAFLPADHPASPRAGESHAQTTIPPQAQPPLRRPRTPRTPRPDPADVLAQWADAVQDRRTGEERSKRA